MDIYYMHCNQMEAAHPSSRAVTLVTNVSHKDTPRTHTHTHTHSTPIPHLPSAALLMFVLILFPEAFGGRRDRHVGGLEAAWLQCLSEMGPKILMLRV